MSELQSLRMAKALFRIAVRLLALQVTADDLLYDLVQEARLFG